MILLVLLVCLTASIPSNAIHRMMTDEERLITFHTSDENSVPPYEVVPISIKKRSADAAAQIGLKAFGSDIKLYLNPTEGILAGYDTPIYRIDSGSPNPKWVNIVQVFNRMAKAVREDTKKSASIIINEEDEGNRIKLHGVVLNDGIAIHPVPERLQEEILNYVKEEINESDDAHYHIVTRIPQLTKNSTEFRAVFEIPHERRAKRAIPKVLYPQILVVLDNDYFVKLGNNIIGMMPYLLSFWNGVDLMYRSIENPKIRLNIAAIVYAGDNRALSYMANNRFTSNQLKGAEALRASGEFWYQQQSTIPLKSYDVIATMTTRKLCENKGGKIECAPIGLATIGGTCKFYGKSVGGRLLIVDQGEFAHIEAATHELGHTLGADHDDRSQCAGQDHRIMWPSTSSGKYASEWSKCSARDFDKFLAGNPDCLYNSPNSGEALSRYLPGRMMDADQQCKKLGYIRVKSIDPEICEQLNCISKEEKTPEGGIIRAWTWSGAAAEGTPCGDGKICLHNRCIDANF